MIAFEVYVNKVKVCTAGLGELDGLIASLVCRIDQDGPPDEKKISFWVGGVGGAVDKKAYRWVSYDMLVGNRVEIRIVDASKTDTPKEYTCPGGSCAI
jgi:hypothetical protein